MDERYKLYDLLYPGAVVAKLCKVLTTDYTMVDLPFIFEKFKIVEPHPVIIIAGGLDTGKGKFYAGIARAAYKTDAVVIDSGIGTGIEPFTMRKSKVKNWTSILKM